MPVAQESHESILEAARTMPADIKTLIAEFGSGEMVEIRLRLQRAVNNQIQGLRSNLETRDSILAATDEALADAGIYPPSRNWLTNFIWKQFG